MKKSSKALALILCLLMMTWMMAGCGDKTETTADGPYTNAAVNSDYMMADDVKAYVDAVDTEYGYDLTYKLAYDEDFWDNSNGWRTSGSDAEHACADFLADEMKEIGLSDVEKVAVPCDKFQANEASLKIDGVDLKYMPASYQCSGTKGDLTAEIVNCGTGTVWDYDGVDMKGKIALVGVDQVNESWIDNYIAQANEAGAAAIITYAVDGYSRAGDWTANVQDICLGDEIPTVAIPKEDADKIIEAMGEEGVIEGTLNVDNEFAVGEGTTYNVMGKIKGKSSDQRIVIAGHYDKYWYGFQDDCAAIGLVYTVAKAMVDSGYQPENDIIFIAHGAEEWGVSDSCFDWTRGAWEMIEKNKDWQGSTLALINCELPAYQVTDNLLSVACVPEFRTVAAKLINESGLVVTAGDVAFNRASVDTTTMEDGVAYRWHGVPYFLNSFEDDNWLHANYHTAADNADTYDEPTFRTNINWYGAFAEYIDQMPALEIDLTQTAEDLKANINDEIDGEAGVDVEAYKAAADEMIAAAAANNDKIAEINAAYVEAAANGDEDKMADLREEGKEMNKKNLAAFQDIQSAFCRVDDFAAWYGHPGMTSNVTYLEGTIEGLNNGVLWGDNEDGALDFAWQLNSAHDYNYILFSKEVGDDGNSMYDPNKMDSKKTLWGYDRVVDVIYVGEATSELGALESLEGVDVAPYIEIYEKGREKALKFIKEYAEHEVKDMTKITESLK